MFTGLASPTHLIILLVIILLLFGAKRIPELGRSLGQGIKEFKEGTNLTEAPEEEQPPKAVAEGEDREQEKQAPKAVEHEDKEKARAQA
jgi:sec-independent protein translocase protein TatA